MRGHCSRTVRPHILAILTALLLICPILPARFSAQADSPGEVVVATYEGVINPVAAEYLHDAIATAQDRKAHALIIRLDTPGGLDTSMRLIRLWSTFRPPGDAPRRPVSS